MLQKFLSFAGCQSGFLFGLLPYFTAQRRKKRGVILKEISSHFVDKNRAHTRPEYLTT